MNLNSRLGCDLSGKKFLGAFSVFVVLLSFFLAHPYAGITGDALLYLLDVIHGIFPERFVGDLYFIGETQQGSFSIFALIYKPLILTLGTYRAALALSTVSVCLWIWAAFRLIRLFTPHHTPLIFVFFACFDFNYGPTNWLRMGEWLCTSRTLAEATTLFGISFLLNEKKWMSGIFFLLGAAFHPLVGGWGLPIWCFTFFPKTRIPVVALSVLFPLTVFIGRIPFAAFDLDWSGACEEFNWSLRSFLLFCAYAVTVFCGWKMFFRNKGKFFKTVFLVLTIAAYWTLASNLSGHIFLYQVQPFRAEWILLFLSLLSMATFVCESLRRHRARRLFLTHRKALSCMGLCLFAILIFWLYSFQKMTEYNGGLSQLIYVFPNIFLFVGSFLAVFSLTKNKFPLFGVAYSIVLAVVAWAIWHESRFGLDDAEYAQLDIFLKTKEVPFEREVQNDYAHVSYLNMGSLYFATGSYYGNYSFLTISKERFLEARRRTAAILNEESVLKKPFTPSSYSLIVSSELSKPKTHLRLLESSEIRFVVSDSSSFFGRIPVDSLYLEALGKTAYLFAKD